MSRLFGKGEYIVYDITGVCQVQDITTMSMDAEGKEKLYYVLEPVGASGSRIITPVEGNKSIMRPILSREEAYSLIDDIRDVHELGITDDKQREAKYKDRMSHGKRLTEVDERYLKKAKENLYRELSIPLEIPAEDVERFITDRIEAVQAD